MKNFLSSVRGCIRQLARRLQTPRFVNGTSRTGLLLERLRPPAQKSYDTLKQSLYSRPTLDWEKQIAVLMRQPIGVVQSLLARNRLHNRRFELRRNSVGRAKHVRAYCERFRIPQRQEYLDLIHSDERSRILASFHFGDFLYGCASLFSLECSTRRRFVLSLNRSAGASFTNLAAGFGPGAPDSQCELLLSQYSSLDLSQLLRVGNTSLLLFCDVPPGLTETTQVRFLNRPAWFSIGPALLALANRVPLLPLFNYSDGRSNFLRLGRQIEPILVESETLREGARRVTQELVSFFEPNFLEFPEQWRFAPLLPVYFCEPSKS